MPESHVLQEFTDGNFAEQALGSSLPVVVDFWASWCGPCNVLAPIIEDVAKEMAGKVAVGKCNIDESPKAAARYSISSIPSLLFINNGRVVDQYTGLLAKKPLLDKIKRVFAL